jgi:soluble lytic murein transglycosylase
MVLLGSALAAGFELNQYPQVNSSEFTHLENDLNDAIKLSKEDKHKAIELLESQSGLPKILENRKNYMLSKLYADINEPSMSFIRAYDTDKDYLPKYNRYKLVKQAEKIGLESVAVKNLDYLIDSYPKNPLFPYELGKSYLRQNLNDKARETFNLVQKSFPHSNYSLGAEYYLANLSGDTEDKLKRFQNYLSKSPDGNLAVLVSDQLLNMVNKSSSGSDNGSDLSEAALAQKYYQNLKNYMALSWFYKEDYQKALSLFDMDLSSEQNTNNVMLVPYASSLAKLGRKTEARDALLNGIPKLQDEKTTRDALDLLLTLSPKTESLTELHALLNQNCSAKDKVLWHIAERSDEKNDYAAVYEQYPDSLYAAESLSRVFWKEFKRKAYHNALEIYQTHWVKYPEAKSHPFVAFWAGKIYLLEDQKDEADAVFKNLIDTHPHNYHSFRAEDILNKKNKWYVLSSSNQFTTFPSWNWPQPYTIEQIKNHYGKDIAELITLQEYDFVLDLESNFEEEKKIKLNDDLKMWLYAMSKDNLKAIHTAHAHLGEKDLVDYNNIKFQYAFPMKYADLIADEVSSNLLIDPLLVHALIRQESHYQNNIVSPVGAIGLMQLMPYTAKEVAFSMKIASPNIDDLMKPDINIKLGVKYMEDVFKKFNGNMIQAIASYNAGPVAVKHWANKAQDQEDMDLFIEDMPYEETRNYVKKVLANYWIYKRLYS